MLVSPLTQWASWAPQRLLACVCLVGQVISLSNLSTRFIRKERKTSVAHSLWEVEPTLKNLAGLTCGLQRWSKPVWYESHWLNLIRWMHSFSLRVLIQVCKATLERVSSHMIELVSLGDDMPRIYLLSSSFDSWSEFMKEQESNGWVVACRPSWSGDILV